MHPALPDRSISEEQLAESSARVRYLVAERLEKIWGACEPYLDTSEGKPDPRFIEAGLRALGALAKLYRLERPVPAENLPDSASRVEVRQLVAQQVRELEERMRQGS